MMPHHLHLAWIRLFWCLLFSNNGSKVTFCISDFYTLLLNNCQQSTVVTKGIVSQYLNEGRGAAILNTEQGQHSPVVADKAVKRDTPSWVANTPGSRSAWHMTGQPHGCNPAEATTKATGLSLKTAP